MGERYNGLPVIEVFFDEKGNVTKENSYNLDKIEIADWQIEALARALLPGLLEFYSHEENVHAAEEWARQQEEQKAIEQCRNKQKRGGRSHEKNKRRKSETC